MLGSRLALGLLPSKGTNPDFSNIKGEIKNLEGSHDYKNYFKISAAPSLDSWSLGVCGLSKGSGKVGVETVNKPVGTGKANKPKTAGPVSVHGLLRRS